MLTTIVFQAMCSSQRDQIKILQEKLAAAEKKLEV